MRETRYLISGEASILLRPLPSFSHMLTHLDDMQAVREMSASAVAPPVNGNGDSIASQNRNALKQLLRSLDPNIEELSSAFERSGLRDPDAVRILAKFPEARRGVFLREDMGLTAFQFHKVSQALQSIVRGPFMLDQR